MAAPDFLALHAPFDALPDPALLEAGRAWRRAQSRPVVMFASSREGEEAEFFRFAAARPA